MYTLDIFKRRTSENHHMHIGMKGMVNWILFKGFETKSQVWVKNDFMFQRLSYHLPAFPGLGFSTVFFLEGGWLLEVLRA